MSYQIKFSKSKLFNSKFVQFIIVIFTLFLFPCLIVASAPNNKYGIHLAQPSHEALKEAKELVNSSGGDWGYTTLVLQEDDRNREKWQEIFDQMRELHLVPIVRLATKPEGENWRRPTKEDADAWVNFLDSLNWVVKNRYIILFNEPNHGAEWGGEVDAQNYAEIAKTFAEKLKKKNKDFFIMLAGLDASAPSYGQAMEDEEQFLKQVINSITIEQYNNLFSGLASHSYPNPGFAGSPYDFGRKTIRTYQWELEILKSLGVDKDLPVFITETGWKRTAQNSEFAVQNYFRTAYESVWGPDERVYAVTPFILDYQGEPFLDFSWKRFQSSEFYSQYQTVQSLSKIKGEPEQIEKGELTFDFPKELVAQSNFHFRLKIKNSGQAIWDKKDNYQLSIINNQQGKLEYLFSDLKNIKPFEEDETDLYLKTDGALGKYKLKIVLTKNGQTVAESLDWQFEVLPLPQLSGSIGLFPKLKTNGTDFEIQIFNDLQELVYKKKNLKVVNSQLTLKNIQNIALGRKYRVVVLKPYYLPRQSFVVFQKGENTVKFKSMYPLDFNKDGKFDGKDIGAFFKNLKLISLLLP